MAGIIAGCLLAAAFEVLDRLKQKN
jgi:hypothetical protein